MDKKQNFKILIIELATNSSNLILTTLQELKYKCFIANTQEKAYDILRIEAIDLVVINSSESDNFAIETIKDVQNLTFGGIVFLTSDANLDNMERFLKYNLLAYKIKLGNILNIINEIDELIARLIENSIETILVIKRKNETRDFVQELLRLGRYDVVMCQNGASAWKKLDNLDSLSMILIDTNLGDMENGDIIKKAKSLFSKSLPVIAIYEQYNPILLQENISHGLSDFITTPILNIEFTLKINLWIDNIKQKREIKRKEDILHQQSKLASMGEMMENIAHQWRQPLNAISISASSMLLSHELGIETDEDTKEQLEGIIEGAEFLSHTINDFQNFLKKDKNPIKFKLQDVVIKVLKFISGNIRKNKITIIQDYTDDIVIFGLENELIQAVLNIINNAKDILVDKKIDENERFILIKLEKDNQHKEAILEIQDSAGGIPLGIIDKIFEPYFTTKHQSQGTGLGLYMTHQMVQNHMKGSIEVENKSFEYFKKQYSGANFKVTIPLDISQSKS